MLMYVVDKKVSCCICHFTFSIMSYYLSSRVTKKVVCCELGGGVGNGSGKNLRDLGPGLVVIPLLFRVFFSEVQCVFLTVALLKSLLPECPACCFL